ncbi:hypothetical protein E8E12_007600 [Didymella heteroderae]|uniref:Uncharacterized protein n=1 Tax=Didymella heteroderae TaxID=1769908 RepID=A0A9P5C0J6_9PLEO|nr:hypothetical protein E8E12_007600 [Didymella heteroderae]
MNTSSTCAANRFARLADHELVFDLLFKSIALDRATHPLLGVALPSEEELFWCVLHRSREQLRSRVHQWLNGISH